ncbi:hypothetical protein ABZ454_17090 [Streptomyces sp. NPDC005803]|uniref:hypothetical protein n=1 Tax=Streptomyces sp. NPDC005803 TaxID=3154297 RepID=UPI0033F49D45
MDQYDSQQPWMRHRDAEPDTPIYDRLVAEWRSAASSPQPLPASPPRPPRVRGFVPAARAAADGAAG